MAIADLLDTEIDPLTGLKKTLPTETAVPPLELPTAPSAAPAPPANSVSFGDALGQVTSAAGRPLTATELNRIYGQYGQAGPTDQVPTATVQDIIGRLSSFLDPATPTTPTTPTSTPVPAPPVAPVVPGKVQTPIYQAPVNAQGQYLTPDGAVIVKNENNTRFTDDRGRVWGLDGQRQPYVVSQPQTTTQTTTGQTVTYTEALARVQQAAGHRLSEAELQRIYAKYGKAGPYDPVPISAVDAIIANKAGWLDKPPDVPPGGTTTIEHVPGPGTNVPGVDLENALSGFDDPSTKYLTDFINKYLTELNAPLNDPSAQQLADLLQGRIKALLQPTTNPDLEAYLKFARERLAQLQTGQPYTDAELQLLQTQALEPIERDRAATKQRVAERMAARGITPDSPMFQSAMNQVDTAFDAMRAQVHGQIGLKGIDTSRENLDKALGLGSSLSDLNVTTQQQAEQRAREALDTATALEGQQKQIRGETTSRRGQALAMASLLSELPEHRLQLANSILTGGQGPESIFNSLLGLVGIQQNQNAINSQANNAFFSGLGALARIVSAGGSTTGGSTGGTK